MYLISSISLLLQCMGCQRGVGSVDLQYTCCSLLPSPSTAYAVEVVLNFVTLVNAQHHHL